mmetsp:Transcript_18647/g.31842  ORF Transcript_18647/g.31842 Transcript_18647/m.31842 type:complete len:92 (+) Transcript_18647:423-698(+)
MMSTNYSLQSLRFNNINIAIPAILMSKLQGQNHQEPKAQHLLKSWRYNQFQSKWVQVDGAVSDAVSGAGAAVCAIWKLLPGNNRRHQVCDR